MAIILVVDDEKGSSSYIQKKLERADYKVITAENGVVALKLLETHEIDLAIVDVDMPMMNGLELLSHFIERQVGFKTIIISGYSNPDMIIKAFRSGAVDFLLKPIDSNYLIDIVERIAKRHSKEGYERYCNQAGCAFCKRIYNTDRDALSDLRAEKEIIGRILADLLNEIACSYTNPKKKMDIDTFIKKYPSIEGITHKYKAIVHRIDELNVA